MDLLNRCGRYVVFCAIDDSFVIMMSVLHCIFNGTPELVVVAMVMLNVAMATSQQIACQKM